MSTSAFFSTRKRNVVPPPPPPNAPSAESRQPWRSSLIPLVALLPLPSSISDPPPHPFRPFELPLLKPLLLIVPMLDPKLAWRGQN